MTSILQNVMSAVLAQSGNSGGGIFGGVFFIFWLAVVVVVLIAMWKVFVKAGQPGWAAIVPIYNTYIMLKIAGRPWWWLLLLLIPIVSIIIAIIVMIDLSKSFGKGIGFAIGLIFLPFIFVPILGFGSAQYQGPAAA